MKISKISAEASKAALARVFGGRFRKAAARRLAAVKSLLTFATRNRLHPVQRRRCGAAAAGDQCARRADPDGGAGGSADRARAGPAQSRTAAAAYLAALRVSEACALRWTACRARRGAGQVTDSGRQAREGAFDSAAALDVARARRAPRRCRTRRTGFPFAPGRRIRSHVGTADREGRRYPGRPSQSRLPPLAAPRPLQPRPRSGRQSCTGA